MLTAKEAGWQPAPLFAGLLVALAIAIAYGNSLFSPFVFDDDPAIIDNSTIRDLWRMDRVLSPPGGGVAVQNRPVVNLTLAINCALGGRHVFGYHLFNLGIHIVAALTLLGIIRRTLLLPSRAAWFGNHSLGYATAVALLWGLHPLNTEAITYVVQRTESLFSMFYLLTVYFCIRGIGSGDNKRWYAAAIAACLLGMGCKEAMVTAPVMVLLYDRVFAAGSWREVLRRRWGLYVGLAATWILLFLILARAEGARGGAAGFGFGMTWWEYARTQFWAICHYLRLAFWPRGLVVDYGTWTARTPGQIIPYALVVTLLVAATLAAWRRWPWVGFLGAWFFVVLAPSSSVVPLVTQTVAEKRMYLPLAAIAALVVFLAAAIANRILNRMVTDETLRRRRAKILAIGAVACAAAILAVLTFLRNHDYRSGLSIWNDAVQKRPDNPRALINRAQAYLSLKEWQKALADADKALEILPTAAQAFAQRGEIFDNLGDKDRALAEYSKAIEIWPDYALAYYQRAEINWKRGDTDRALEDYNKAIELRPDARAQAQPYVNRGVLYARAGKVEKAIEDLDHAIAVDPNFAETYSNRGNVYRLTNNLDGALKDYSRAIELKPDYVDAWLNRGATFIDLGANDRAVQDLTRAIELKPDSPDGYANRAIAYYYLKDYKKAWADVNQLKTLGAAPSPQLMELLTQAEKGQAGPF